MASAAAAGKSTHQAQTRSRGGGIGSKLIGGLGIVLTMAVVAGAIMFDAPQSSTAVAPQVAAATSVAPTTTPTASNTAVAPSATIKMATVKVVTSPPAAAAPASNSSTTECRLLPRRFFVTGSGTVRLRAEGYVSPTIVLSGSAQEVDLPQRRPAVGEVLQNIVVEGKADFILLTTDYVDYRQGLRVNGVENFDIYWAPLKSC
jgi:hypothetical protein